MQIQMHLGCILFILRCGGCAEPDGITEIVYTQTGHDRVQIQNAQCLSGLGIQHNIVQFGVVVGHTQGQYMIVEHLLQTAAHFLHSHGLQDLGLCLLLATNHIQLNGLFQLLETVGGVVEVGDSLK